MFPKKVNHLEPLHCIFFFLYRTKQVASKLMTAPLWPLAVKRGFFPIVITRLLFSPQLLCILNVCMKFISLLQFTAIKPRQTLCLSSKCVSDLLFFFLNNCFETQLPVFISWLTQNDPNFYCV